MSKRKLYTVCCVILAIVVFGGSYYLYLNRYKDNKKSQPKSEVSSNTVMGKVDFKNVVNNKTKLIFKTIYMKSGSESLEEKIVGKDAKELIGFDRAKIEEKYTNKGFDVEKMNNSEIILIKREDKYAPDKYVVGIKKTDNGEYLAIFRTDNEGNLCIENEKDITAINIKVLRDGDIELLRNGCSDFEFNNKEKAQELISEYES
ncbi:hypothetical protein ACFIJ5_06065 [Haloimpatiens sp. FM7330]|uniref:hypothetical protein n=1 Tax=Haloimpatiens sp. FM7330 TaxID=3298610 RepID=UPI0036254F34